MSIISAEQGAALGLKAPKVLSPDQGAAVGLGQPEPSTGEAIVRGLAQGLTADWSDEAAGALDYMKKVFTPGQHATRADYEKGRDESRGANKRAEAAHPTAYGAAKIAGNVGLGAATLPLSPVVAGAALGGANAAGGSEQQGTALAKEAAMGLAGGAVAGKVGEMAVKLVGAGMRTAGPAMGRASDKLTAQALGGTADRETAGVFREMSTSLRPGALTERAGRLGLMDPISWSGRREAATVAMEKVAQERMGVMKALDHVPDMAPPNFKSLAAGVATNQHVIPLLNHPTQGAALSDVAQEFLAPLASTHGWAGRNAAVQSMEQTVRPLLDKLASGQSLAPVEAMKVAVYRATRGVFLKEAEDAAERAGQPMLSAQLNSLGKDEALSRMTHRAANDKILSEDTNEKSLRTLLRLDAAYKLATGHPVQAALAAAGGSDTVRRAAVPLAAKALGAVSGAETKLSGVMAKTARAVAAGGDDAAAAVLGERAGKEPDELNVAAAHMVAQQTGGTYQKKAGELAKRLSKEKPK